MRRRAPTSSSDRHTATLILTNYPDLEQVELKRALLRYVGVLPQNIAVANDFVLLLEATLPRMASTARSAAESPDETMMVSDPLAL